MLIRQSGLQQGSQACQQTPDTKMAESDPLDDVPFPSDPMLCDLSEAFGVDVNDVLSL